MRMLMNNLDPDVAERPQDLVVYGGTGKAARSWEAFDAIVRTLRTLGDDETMLVQSGKPVGVFRTHEMAPRVLIANSMLVPKWATWDTFRELEHAGLTMYGQMTAGSWIYIGTQGILQGTYETFAEAATQRFGGSLAGTVTLTGGLGGMGGAQPLAVTMNGGVALCVEVDPARIERRIKTRYLDRESDDLDEALRWVDEARSAREAVSIGLRRQLRRRPARAARAGVRAGSRDRPDERARPAGRVRAGRAVARGGRAAAGRRSRRVQRRSLESMARHVEAMVGFLDGGRGGVRLREQPAGGRRGRRARRGAYAYPGFVPAFIRPMFCEGKGPFRWAALSGDPEDIAKTDRAVAELFPENERLHRWLDMAEERVAFQGLPARICWLGYGERAKAGLRFNEMVASGRGSAPIVIGRDHLDCGLRRLAVPRDGGDEGRLGRDRGLADPERAREHRGRRALGQRPPRRRRRDRVLDPRRDGRRGRRERERGRAARARPDDRSREWASCGTPTRATRRRSPSRPIAGFGCPGASSSGTAAVAARTVGGLP